MNIFLRGIAMLSLVRLLVDMLAPEGNTRRFCDMALGFVLMLSMLRAARSLLQGGIT